MLPRWVQVTPDRVVLSTTGVDGVSGWTNASQVAGGYRNGQAIGPTNTAQAFSYDLSAAKREAYEPYHVSFDALVTGAGGTYAECEYGPRIPAAADWQHVEYVVRWPSTDAMLASGFRVQLSQATSSAPTSFKIDNLKVVRMERDQYADYSDTIITELGGDIPAFSDASRLALLPTTVGTLANGGIVTSLMFGDSLSASTSFAAIGELVGRTYPGVTWNHVNYAIGGSDAERWTTSDGPSAMETFISEVLPTIIIFGCISDAFTTSANWNALIDQIKALRDEYVETADILVCSKLYAAGTQTSSFMESVATSNGVALFDADAKFREWFGGDVSHVGTHTFSLPDGTHPDNRSREYLGRSLAWFFGASAP